VPTADSCTAANDARRLFDAGGTTCPWFGNDYPAARLDDAAALDPVAGDYETMMDRSGCTPTRRIIARLHSRCLALPEREAVAAAVRRRQADDLETAVVSRGGNL
jgi:hypothetical protein